MPSAHYENAREVGMEGDLIDNITPLIITYNEEANLPRVLSKLSWAKRIVIIDSGSTDETIQLASRIPQVQVVRRTFDTFAQQCNYGLSQITTDWVLSLDADYVLSDALVEELRTIRSNDAVGYRAGFIYSIFGRSLKGTIYPPRVVLYRKDLARYEDEGHGHRVRLAGAIEKLRQPIFHDDRKSLTRWFASQQSYAIQEADFLLAPGSPTMRWTDRMRRLGWFAPFAVFFYVLFVKGAIFDGRAGRYYAFQRLAAEVIIALELMDRRLRGVS